MSTGHTPAIAFDEWRWEGKSQKAVYRHTAALSLIEVNTQSVLDVGCGDGLFLGLVHTRLSDSVLRGIDWSPTAIEMAKDRTPGAEFKLLDATSSRLPFEDKEFDVVVALDVLEHTYKPEELLRELARVARTSVIVGVPNFSSLPARIQTFWGKVPENNTPEKGHVYWFNYFVLKNMAVKLSLRITRLEMNHQGMSMPVIATVIAFFLKLFPNLFALSFVVKIERT